MVAMAYQPHRRRDRKGERSISRPDRIARLRVHLHSRARCSTSLVPRDPIDPDDVYVNEEIVHRPPRRSVEEGISHPSKPRRLEPSLREEISRLDTWSVPSQERKSSNRFALISTIDTFPRLTSSPPPLSLSASIFPTEPPPRR